MTHALKTWPVHFAAIKDGSQKAELRKADRPFTAGDKLLLQEYGPGAKAYTGEELELRITHVFTNEDLQPLKAGYVMLSFEPFTK